MYINYIYIYIYMYINYIYIYIWYNFMKSINCLIVIGPAWLLPAARRDAARGAGPRKLPAAEGQLHGQFVLNASVLKISESRRHRFL